MKNPSLWRSFALVALLTLGCEPATDSGDTAAPECTAHAQCADPDKPFCDPDEQACAERPAARRAPPRLSPGLEAAE